MPRTFALPLVLCAMLLALLNIPATESLAQTRPDTPALGSADFRPTPDHPLGWRGDGTGLYPGANPPLSWGRQGQFLLADWKSQLDKPTRSEVTGTPLTPMLGAGDGHFLPTAWLALGLYTPTKDNAIENEEPLADIEKLWPQDGQTTAGMTWKKITGNQINFHEAFGHADAPRLAYACCYLYAPTETDAAVRCGRGENVKIWINEQGQTGSGYDTWRRFKKGWNRLLIKVQVPAYNEKYASHSTYGISLFQCRPDQPYKSQNIAWITPMPGRAPAMPVIVGDKIFVTAEPSDLLCLDKNTGKLLWMNANTLYDVAVQDVTNGVKINFDPALLKDHAAKLAQLNDAYVKDRTAVNNDDRVKLEWELISTPRNYEKHRYTQPGEWGGGNCSCSPVTDGQFIYAWFGETGVLAAYDLTGQRQWLTSEHSHWGGGHGVNSSPVLAGNNIICQFKIGVYAFDKHTGKTLWTMTDQNLYACATPAVIKTADDYAIILGSGQVLRASDGKVITPALGQFGNDVPSPVPVADAFYLFSRDGLLAARIPETLTDGATLRPLWRVTRPPNEFRDGEIFPLASHLVHDGILYFTHTGYATLDFAWLYAADAATGKLIYKQKLDALHPAFAYDPQGGGATASLALAGNKALYIMDNRGTTLVLKPGREFKPLATNFISNINPLGQETTISTPIFDANRMYYRGYDNLYCITDEAKP